MAILLGLSILETHLTGQLYRGPAARVVSGNSLELDAEAFPTGVSLAVLGGFRGLVADLQWVRVYGDWARHDLAAMRRRLWWVGEIDPRPLTFWLNGARMLAFDAMSWRIAAGEDVGRVAIEQLREAEAFLERARPAHGHRSAIDIELAVLRLRMTADVAGALVALERADACEDAPYFVGRLRGELLVRAGRPAEALSWLRQMRARLPNDDPRAMVEVVDQRIAQLQRELER